MCVFSHQLSQLLLILYSIRTYFSNLNLKPSLLFGFLKISSSGSKWSKCLNPVQEFTKSYAWIIDTAMPIFNSDALTFTL